ncbi:MAG: AI-2E family transporter [Chlamydiota bacterium]|nr:AI-2E family transporter [Chlamydiota bacterium]
MTALLEFFLGIAIPTLIFYLLWAGSDMLIPLVIAIVIWYLIISITSAIQKISYKKWKFPYGISLLLAITVCGFIIYWVFGILTTNITQIIIALPGYQERLVTVINDLSDWAGLKNPPNVGSILNQDHLVSFVSGVAQTMTSIAGNMGIILIYVLFLILERESFDSKLSAMIKDKSRLAKTQRGIKKVSSQIQSYLRIKTFLSILTAVCSYGIMIFIGVDFASFWAQLIFFFNFIPTIGSIIGTALPCILTLLQFDSWGPFIFVTSLLILLQFVIGNILEPRLIGKTVNLSGLVIIVSLALWGNIWGITGMFLCVPIMVMANIFFANFEKTRPIAIMLSSNGEIDQSIDE